MLELCVLPTVHCAKHVLGQLHLCSALCYNRLAGQALRCMRWQFLFRGCRQVAFSTSMACQFPAAAGMDCIAFVEGQRPCCAAEHTIVQPLLRLDLSCGDDIKHAALAQPSCIACDKFGALLCVFLHFLLATVHATARSGVCSLQVRYTAVPPLLPFAYVLQPSMRCCCCCVMAVSNCPKLVGAVAQHVRQVHSSWRRSA